MIRYISTRGPGDPKSFMDVILSGIAPDGGLYVPDLWPNIDRSTLTHLSGVPYTVIAANVMAPFIGNMLSPATLQQILVDAYDSGSFDHNTIAPLNQIGPNAWLLELYHGPTLSFKDYAMQFIGHLFDHVLDQQKRKMTIIGATSGDTGSAAIEACKNCKNITTIILHPKGRTSDVQRKQMTRVDSENIHNIAIEGTFDDCQSMVKAMLTDEKLKQDLQLSAVNSINWARIMAQMVYYVSSAIALGAPHRSVSFTVPTGNFGNVYSAWCARQIGLPIEKLTIASNRNDVLTRFFETGHMTLEKVMPSLSPSMDIQVSSNFERYLFDLSGRNAATVNSIMGDLKSQKSFNIDSNNMQRARQDFASARCSDDETLSMMRECYESTGILIDPHTAVGLHAATKTQEDPTTPNIILACAHPAKFPDAVFQATGIKPKLPDHLADLMSRPERFTVMPNDLDKVKTLVKNLAAK